MPISPDANRQLYAQGHEPLFQATIGLRYETTPDQLRFVAAQIRKLLVGHL